MRLHQEFTDDGFRSTHLSQFWGSLIGTAVGYAMALVVACLVFPPPQANYHLSGTLKWVSSLTTQEVRESGFYLLMLALGGAGSLVGSMVDAPPANRFRQLLLLASVPITAWTAQTVIPRERFATLPVLIPFGIWTVVLAQTLRNTGGLLAQPILIPKAEPCSNTSPRSVRQNLATILIPLVVFMTMLCPISPRLVAGWMNNPKCNCHIATYLVGPATYFHTSGLIPGIDYFTQYSVGYPYLFSWMLADRVEHTLINAVWFLTAIHIIFFTSLSVFLTWFLSSRRWALVISVALAIIQFHTSEPMWNPSHYPVRYPLMMIAGLSFLRWTMNLDSRARAVELALVLSGSLFVNTETGVYFAVASTIGAFLVCPGWKQTLTQVAVLNTLVVLWFLGLSGMAFGLRVLDPDYLYYLFEPLWIYGGGMGGIPLAWNSGWHYLANIICPVIALASLGWIAIIVRSPRHSGVDRRQLAAIVFFSLAGLFMMAKYVNRSNLSVWITSVVPFGVVFGWWARTLSSRLRDKYRASASWALFGLVLLFVVSFYDINNPAVYSFRSYRVYPTLINRVFDVFGIADAKTATANLDVVAAEDVELIRKHTQPGERIAVFHPFDWWYLVSAKRASHFHFVPSTMMFTERQVSESGLGLSKLFLPVRPIDADLMGVEMDETFYQHFRWEEDGKDLALWRTTSE